MSAQEQALNALDHERRTLETLQQRRADAVDKTEDVSTRLTQAQEQLATAEVEDIVSGGDASTKARKAVAHLLGQQEDITAKVAALDRALVMQREAFARADDAYSATVKDFLFAKFDEEIVAFADALADAAKLQKPLRETVAALNARKLQHQARDLAFTWHEVAFTAEYPNAVMPGGMHPLPIVVPKKLGWWLDRLRAYGYKVEAGRNDAFALPDGNALGFDDELRAAFAIGEAHKAEALQPRIGAAERLAITTRDILRRIGL